MNKFIKLFLKPTLGKLKSKLNRLGYVVRKKDSIEFPKDTENSKKAIKDIKANTDRIKSFDGFKVVDQDREFLYDLVSEVFKNMNISPIIFELGVLRGENARNMYDKISPKEMFLIDAWSKQDLKSFEELNKGRDWVEGIDEQLFVDYFGGSLKDQSTFDNLLNEAKQRFLGINNVHFIRSSTSEAPKKLANSLRENVHLIYVDANHQYETVLDDLIDYLPFLHPHYGLFQLNDCCHSDSGIKQNLGVLEASFKFCRMFDFIPLVVVNRDFTDVILAKRGSLICELIDNTFNNSNIAYVELPSQLYPVASIKNGIRGNLSFV